MLRVRDEGKERPQEMRFHRLDLFARKFAAPMLDAVRSVLEVFCGESRYRWSMEQLLGQLRLAEDIARDMLRELAGQLFVFPMEEPGCSMSNPPAQTRKSVQCIPSFRLGVRTTKCLILEVTPPENCQATVGEAELPSSETEELSIGSVTTDFGPEGIPFNSTSKLETHLAALDNVLEQPGKHAARMARALYRAKHEGARRLFVKHDDELLLDSIDEKLAAHRISQVDAFRAYYKFAMSRVASFDTS